MGRPPFSHTSKLWEKCVRPIVSTSTCWKTIDLPLHRGHYYPPTKPSIGSVTLEQLIELPNQPRGFYQNFTLLSAAVSPYWPCKSDCADGVSHIFDHSPNTGWPRASIMCLSTCSGRSNNSSTVYSRIPLTLQLVDIVVKIAVGLLSILALATKELKQR